MEKNFLKVGLLAGFLIGVGAGFTFAASDMRAAEVIAEYKAGKIVCGEVAGELVCRSSK